MKDSNLSKNDRIALNTVHAILKVEMTIDTIEELVGCSLDCNINKPNSISSYMYSTLDALYSTILNYLDVDTESNDDDSSRIRDCVNIKVMDIISKIKDDGIISHDDVMSNADYIISCLKHIDKTKE